MTLANFYISLQSTEKLLIDIDFLKMKGIKSINKDGVSSEFKSVCQKNDYFKTYRTGLLNFDFDFLLKDDSFFQFSFVESNKNIPPEIRYSFYQNPQEFKTIEEFVFSLQEQDINLEGTPEEIYGILHEEYQQYLSEQQINSANTTIRYDVDETSYTPLIHSVSHFHVGHMNHVRIPCDKIITPLKFVLFTLKHVYYYEWKDLIQNEKSFLKDVLHKEKTFCSSLDAPHWADDEMLELFLT